MERIDGVSQTLETRNGFLPSVMAGKENRYVYLLISTRRGAGRVK